MPVYNDEGKKVGGFAIPVKAYMARPRILRFEELVAINEDDRNQIIGESFKRLSETDYETFRSYNWDRGREKKNNAQIQFTVPINYYSVVKDWTKRFRPKSVNVSTVVATFVSSYIRQNS